MKKLLKHKTAKMMLLLLLVASFMVGLASFAGAQTSPPDLGIDQISSTIGLANTDIRLIVARIIRVALGLLGIVAVCIVLYGGYLWMTAGGNDEQVGTAKKVLINGAIGLALILSSYAIVSFVMNKLVEATTGSSGQSTTGGTTGGQGYFSSNFFYLINVPSSGDMCIRNLKLSLTFNKNVDKTTLAGNIIVKKKSDGKEVAGSWDWVSASNKYTVVFTPSAACGGGLIGCYEPSTDYTLEFKKASSVKTTDNIKLKELLCAMSKGQCKEINFKTGSGVDQKKPTVVDIIAQPPLQAGRAIPVKIDFTDDNGVQKIDLIVNGKLAGSASPAQNCQKSGSVNISWNTGSLSAGKYQLTGEAFDYAMLSDSKTVSVTLLPTHCFDGMTNNDEEAEDCGGKDCYACNITRITDFSPKQAAPGSFMTITGHKFGTGVGKVFMQDIKGLWNIPADLADCGLNAWTDKQIIVKIPSGTAPSTAIQVITKDNKSDTTNDTVLPKIINLTVNSQLTPGLCQANPAKGSAGITTVLSGVNFGKIPGKVVFGEKNFTNIGNWTDGGKSSYTQAQVPIMGAGATPVQVINDKGIKSNKIRFDIDPLPESSKPIITSVSPDNGALGEYITIRGTNFGTTRGDVYFFETTDTQGLRNEKGKFNFPQECKNTWSNDTIIVKFPADSTIAKKNYKYKVKVKINGVSSNLSKDVFQLSTDSPRPGICKMSPISGPVPLAGGIELVGENIDSSARVYFWKQGADYSTITQRLISNVFNLQNFTDGQLVTTTPPIGTDTGPVAIYSKAQLSNGINYEVFDCSTGQKNCKTGYHCCQSGLQKGSCLQNGTLCSGQILSTAYVYRFSTGLIPKIPTVLEQCYTSKRGDGSWPFPSPSPSQSWNSMMLAKDRDNICLQSSIVVDFSTKIEPLTLGKDVIVNECNNSKVDTSKGDCVAAALAQVEDAITGSSVTIIPLTSSKTATDETQYFELIAKGAVWKSDQWYQVVVNDSVKFKNAKGIITYIAKTKPCKVANSAYCFLFKTGKNNCQLKGLVITPYKYYTSMLQEPIGNLLYRGHGLASQNCVAMSIKGFNKEWYVLDVDKEFAAINGPTSTITAQADSKKNTVAIGRKNPVDAVNVNLALSTSTPLGVTKVTGNSPLTIDLTNPRVLDYGPKCLEACPNAVGWVTFNVPLSSTNLLTSGGALRLYKCSDENCLSKTAINISLGNGIEFAGNSPDTLEFTKLEAGALYLVEVSDDFDVSTADPNINTKLLWVRNTLSNPKSKLKPYTKKFSWRFRTKKQNCTVNRVSVSPLKYLAKNVTARSVFYAAPYSSPDACSKFGQRLNGWNYQWNWASSDLQVAVVQEVTTYGTKNYCTQDCLIKGSDIAYGNVLPMCGNKVVESGEDCDPPNGKKGCSINCLFTGNTVTTNTPGIDVGECGDGHVSKDKGEECDPGDSNTKLGCEPTNCLKMGSTSNPSEKKTSLSVCGNGTVGIEEECDTGIKADIKNQQSSLYCTDKCLHAGSKIFEGWCVTEDTSGNYGGFKSEDFQKYCKQPASKCGDGIDSPDEDPGCDSKGGVGKWCNNNCLINDYVKCEAAKKKDPSLTFKCNVCKQGDEGCDKTMGQHLGSSIYYSTPSFCGDKKVGIGEDTICEGTSNISNTHTITNPWALVKGIGSKINVKTVALQEQKSEISAKTSEKNSTNFVTGKGEFIVACGYEKDKQCVDANGKNYGLANNTCCYKRTNLTKIYPGSLTATEKQICPNTSISIEFDDYIDQASLAGNIIIARGYDKKDQGNCSSTEDYTNLLVDLVEKEQPWYQRIFSRIARFVRSIFTNNAYAQVPSTIKQWCGGDDLGTARLYKRSSGEGALIQVQLARPLATSTYYTIIIKPGLKDVAGVSMAPDTDKVYKKWSFETDKDICKLTDVEIDPNQIYFDKRSGMEVIEVKAKTTKNRLIQPIVGYYDWFYKWSPYVNNYFSMKYITTTAADPNEFKPRESQGTIYSHVTAEIKTDKYNTGTKDKEITDKAQVIVYFCENPWPPKSAMIDLDQDGIKEKKVNVFPFEDVADPMRNNDGWNKVVKSFDGTPFPKGSGYDYFNWSTYYCADSGQVGKSDDLPFLRPEVEESGIFGSLGGESMKTYIFTNDKNEDAIYVKVLPNQNKLSLAEWYKKQGYVVASSLTSLYVNGYEAINDGSSIYVDALNYNSAVVGGTLYNNIYVFGINNDASSDTKKVFEEFLKNLRFNANIINEGLCGKDGNISATSTCKSDLHCKDGETCYAPVDKMKNNYQRLKDLQTISSYLDATNGSEPTLPQGTLVNGQTISVWPSWISALSSKLNTNLPIDPVNKLGKIGTCKNNQKQVCLTDSNCSASDKCLIHDSKTGWRTEDMAYSFVCNTSSLAYRYLYSSQNGYSLRARFENPFGNGVITNSIINNWWTNGTTKGFTSYYIDATKVIINQNTGICLQSGELTTNSNISICGNNTIEYGEDCEKGGTKQIKSDCTATQNKMRSYTCNVQCKWDEKKEDCSKYSFCGNGQKEHGEFCDDGEKNGSWNSCNKSCSAYVKKLGLMEIGIDGHGQPYNEPSPGYCGDQEITGEFEICDISLPEFDLYSKVKDFSCDNTCLNRGGYCGDKIVQEQFEECEADVSCITDSNLPGKKICNMTSPNDFERCMFKDGGKCVADKQTETKKTGCNNGVQDPGEICDWGDDESKPLYNNKTCDPPYGGTCSFCTDKCEYEVVQAKEHCGDGIVQPKFEACETVNGIVYAAATTTKGIGQYNDLKYGKEKPHPFINGFRTRSCSEEYLMIGNWFVTKELYLRGNVRQGTKKCVNKCTKIENKCIECGVDEKKGIKIKGQVVNAVVGLKNPLMASKSNQFTGTIDLSLGVDKISAKAYVPYDKTNEIDNGFEMMYRHDQVASNTVAMINSDSQCSFGKDDYKTNYQLSINAAWSNMFDFDVLTEESVKKAPWSNDLVLSPMILAKDRTKWYQPTDMMKAAVKPRPQDIRLVVSWVDGSLNFQSGFLVPEFSKGGKCETGGPFSGGLPFCKHSLEKINIYEGTSNFGSSNAVQSILYYLPSFATKVKDGIFYHGFNSTKSKTAVESYTIDSSRNYKYGATVGAKVSRPAAISAFYVRIPNADIDNYRQNANLKVDIYIADDYVQKAWKDCCSNEQCTDPRKSPPINRVACRYDYRLFSKPYKTLYLSNARKSASNDMTSYWHVLNFKEGIDYTNPANYFDFVDRISTGPQFFEYEYSNKITK